MIYDKIYIIVLDDGSTNGDPIAAFAYVPNFYVQFNTFMEGKQTKFSCC